MLTQLDLNLAILKWNLGRSKDAKTLKNNAALHTHRITMLCIMMKCQVLFIVYAECHYAECHYAEYR
jgi:hypothetical protein